MTPEDFYIRKEKIKNQIENLISGFNLDDNDDDAPIRFGEALGEEKVKLISNLIEKTAEISVEYGGYNGQFSSKIDYLSDREKCIHYFCNNYLYFLSKQQNNPEKARERILKRRTEMIKKLKSRN